MYKEEVSVTHKRGNMNEGSTTSLQTYKTWLHLNDTYKFTLTLLAGVKGVLNVNFIIRIECTFTF